MKEYLILHMIALAVGIAADVMIGDPQGLPHPVRAIGALISYLEERLNREEIRRKDPAAAIRRGALMWVIVVSLTVIITGTILICAYTINPYAGAALEAVLTYYILAAGSLRDETMKVYTALTCDKEPDAGNKEKDPGNREKDADKNPATARRHLSMIVGRDTDRLDEEGIIRAAVETVAENTSDGVIAPLLYTAVLGPVAGMLYKAVNTMDSMAGYRNERFEYFGRVPAVADDIFNFIPSRLAATFMTGAAYVLGLPQKLRRDGGACESEYDGRGACTIWRRDRYNHKSPNSAQTESVCAGALGIRLGGNAYYAGVLAVKPYIGDCRRNIEATDIVRAIRLMFATEALCTAVIYIIMISILIFPLI